MSEPSKKSGVKVSGHTEGRKRFCAWRAISDSVARQRGQRADALCTPQIEDESRLVRVYGPKAAFGTFRQDEKYKLDSAYRLHYTFS